MQRKMFYIISDNQLKRKKSTIITWHDYMTVEFSYSVYLLS